MRMRILVMSMIFISIGIIGLIFIIIFKNKVNDFYDKYETLSEIQKKYYKNIIIYIPFIIFIVFGLYYLIAELSGFDMSRYLNSKNVNIYQIGGVLAVIYGIITLVLRFTKLKYSLFSKLHTFEDKHGYNKGNYIHVVSYTIIPILFGIFLLIGILP